MFESKRYIYEVYKEMSFSRAAKNLYISQPSLSNAVKKAEEELGFQIFDRSTSPIRLTEPGREYIHSIELIMDVESRFENYVNDMNGLKTGSLAIGGTSLFTSCLLPPMLSAFTEKYPQISIDIVEATSAELENDLAQGALDMLLDNSSLDTGQYDRRFVCKEHLLLTVPCRFITKEMSSFALTAGDIREGRHLEKDVKRVPMQIFSGLPFILLREGNDTRIRADKIFQEEGFAPDVKLVAEQQLTAYNLACYGMGITFAGDVLISHTPGASDVLYFRPQSSGTARDVNFFFRRNRYMSKAMREFLKMI